MTKQDVFDAIEKLKELDKIGFQNLSVFDLTLYVNLKTNLLRTFKFVWQETFASVPTEALVSSLFLNNSNSIKNDVCSSNSLNSLMEVDTEIFDEERSFLREHFQEKKVKIIINQQGKSFIQKLTNKKSIFRMTLPTDWDIEIEASLLLDLYDKDFKKPSNTNFYQKVINLFLEKEDYSLVKKAIEKKEISFNFSPEEIELIWNSFQGLNFSTSLILCSLKIGIEQEKIPMEKIEEWIGKHKKRLINFLKQ